ncbi:hypothetical protein ACOMHN_023400 [Nucella lapillus]
MRTNTFHSHLIASPFSLHSHLIASPFSPLPAAIVQSSDVQYFRPIPTRVAYEGKYRAGPTAQPITLPLLARSDRATPGPMVMPRVINALSYPIKPHTGVAVPAKRAGHDVFPHWRAFGVEGTHCRTEVRPVSLTLAFIPRWRGLEAD